MKYPRIHLSIDNCFASKRWTKPEDWMKKIRECGIRYVECSADTECDMLYSDRGYLDEWADRVRCEGEKSGISIASVYTGHGTYSTLGLTHTDDRCRERMLHGWLYRHIDNAARLGAIAGFYCHAFDDTVVSSSERYSEYCDILCNQLKKAAVYAKEKSVILSLEQMYSPQQYPWRIKDAKELIRSTYQCGAPVYLTIDTGHQFGQQHFLKPDIKTVICAIEEKKHLYVGAEEAHNILLSAQNGNLNSSDAASEIMRLCEENDHLFSEPCDSDTWSWIKNLGKYSPIIHLQQTDNTSSAHRDFSPENNSNGMITGVKLLTSLYESYNTPNENGMPMPVEDIYLTLELFYPNTAKGYDIVNSLGISAEYWRRFIPEDGMTLDELVKRL